ncbi:pyridoxal phosphate-dependent decarboxylase family protein [Cognatishimia activa]|uniref:L-2,4-diaminobutyrate decarboxylase n=1 Tax=Cognatishimia activa TaxID=1715691 RepID=A0A0N7MBL7_9RHOB|nr:pyridoxal-dependent decarboxylase [Cognatishimia activa]CUJ11049.1 L-2,4-diaminobutyrate decarboxylase [Cognatishimia activa]CUK25760.1 L-2,4-diaminobutyrate decarboxylase [Cognatishimia activa]
MSDKPLDPQDWSRFRADAHELLDHCLDLLQGAEDRPWQHPPEDLEDRYAIGQSQQQNSDLMTRLRDEVLPYHAGNTHPKYWGWVQGSGLATDVTASMVSAVMNSNCGGRNHGANYMERAVIDWTRRKMGLPETAFGVLVTGTSQATVQAFAAARVKVVGKDVRQQGHGTQRLTAYAAAGVHNATKKALELIGVGSDNLRLVPLKKGQMDIDALYTMIAEDRAAGALPFLVVGTAGSVNLGFFDNFNALADVAQSEGLWLHVDGAFGAWTRIADEPYRSLTDGLERADSIALDFHKWMYVGFDCGLCLVRDGADLRATFAARPDYLDGKDRGVASGEPWFCDYGIDLSRGNRALKIWMALESFGEDAFSAAITQNCHLAKQMAQEVQAQPKMALGQETISNVCVFTADKTLSEAAQSELNVRIAVELQESGQAVFSTTKVNGVEMLRAAIVNHRTREADISDALAAVSALSSA